MASQLMFALTPTPLSPLVAGVDEVGRGALFGPVVAAAVVLPSPEIRHHLQTLGVTDSKKLNAKRREKLAQDIKLLATDYAIGLASVYEIDRLNILQATFLAMKRAIRRLKTQPGLCLVDGTQPLPQLSIPQRTIIRGDQTHTEIAAASIIAKVWRDALIVRLDHRYPGYDLRSNKGYGSAKHRQGLQRLGATYQHRKSFKGCGPASPLNSQS
jgi:ribonuclease HII